MRNTKQRDAVLAALRATRTHPTAAEVYAAVRKTMPHISLGTVYRNLGALTAEGEILALDTGGGTVHYDGFTAPHTHFVCDGCGRVFDFPPPPALPSTDGFFVREVRVILAGDCPDCRKNKIQKK